MVIPFPDPNILKNRKRNIAESGQIRPDRGGGKILQGSTGVANWDNQQLMETFIELKDTSHFVLTDTCHDLLLRNTHKGTVISKAP